MGKRTAKPSDGQLKLVPSREEFLEGIREEVRTRMRVAVMDVVQKLFEEEKRELCGDLWSRKDPGQLRSGGTERGKICLEGRRAVVRYPRVVDERGSRGLPTYQALSSYDLMAEDVQEKLLRGVSARDYGEVVTRIVEGSGLKRDLVSRSFIRASKKSLEEINGRDLSGHQFVALMIDGIGFGQETLLVAAMGITTAGEKVFLGLAEGHTENSAVVGTLLDNLVGRGLSLTDHFLAVLDGAKALKAAVTRRWQGRVWIQRCQVHKKRNVLEHLSPTYQAEARRRMNVAYGMKIYDEAKKVLENTVRWLEGISEPAARSLEEGMEETLTVVKLGLPELLGRTLSTTNPLESAFDGVRYRTGRVKRWRTGKGRMAARWASSALLVVEKRLHKVKGHRVMNVLLEALKSKKLDGVKEVG
jgi:transposase-like protein